MKVSSRRWLLLPLEIKSRELDAKMMLACIAADRGYGVLLGRNGFNRNGCYPQGVYLDKCISVYKKDVLYEQVNKLGNKLASLDEEGLVYYSGKDFIRERTSEKTVDLSSLIFTWGDVQRQEIISSYDVEDKVTVTGSPRSDLWSPKMHWVYEEKVQEIQSKFGNTILIPSNFAAFNNANGSDFFVKQQIKYGVVKKLDNIEKLERSVNYIGRLFDEFVKLIPMVAEENAEHTVILRPHPADNINKWLDLSKKWPKNVVVKYEGSVSPWIVASDLLVHNSCTTGVEAFGMEKAAIAYTPFADELFKINLPNLLSQQAESVDDVLSLIKSNLGKNGLGREENKIDLYNSYIKAAAGEHAGERIMDAIDLLHLSAMDYEFAYGFDKRIRTVARKINRRINALRGKYEFSLSYMKQKNPGINLLELKRLVAGYKRRLELPSSISVGQVDENVFCIYKEKSKL